MKIVKSEKLYNENGDWIGIAVTEEMTATEAVNLYPQSFVGFVFEEEPAHES